MTALVNQRSSLTEDASSSLPSRAGQPQADLQALHTTEQYSLSLWELSAAKFVVLTTHSGVSQPCHAGDASDDRAVALGPGQESKSCKLLHW